MALPWDYAEWPKPDESEEEVRFAQLQDAEFESALDSSNISDDEWPELAFYAPAIRTVSSFASTHVQTAGNPNVKVWVNTNSGVYHCPGKRWYGNPKEGAYMTKRQEQNGHSNYFGGDSNVV